MQKEKYFGLSPRIARWKLDNPFENWLSYRADHSQLFKRLYLLYYCLVDREYYYKGVKIAKDVFTNHTLSKGVSDLDAVIRDMIYCLHRFGISFQDYCIYEFVNNNDLAYRNSFVSDKLRYHYCDMLNSPGIYKIMTNKYACYQKYREFFKRDMVGCFVAKDKVAFTDFINKHTSFIYKPLEDHSGHGIDVFKTNEIEPLGFFEEKLSNGPFVLEELIEQGEEVACIHPQSVNSCRVLTFTNQGDVIIIGATWRVGLGNAIKDNAGAGGMYAFINPKTGIVETDAINYWGEHFKQHPDTGITFEGFHMPLWNEAIDIIGRMATHIDGSTLIAWDIAYSTKGWVMVEANENGDWSIIQSNKKKGMKSILFEYMNIYFKTNKTRLH